MTDLQGALVGTVIGLAFVAITGYLIYSHYVIVATSVAVDATVLESEIGVGDTTPGEAGGQATFPQVEYRYTYEGQTYTSTNICPGHGTGCYGPQTEDNARKVIRNYPEGERITAYVDPEDPSRAHLDHGSVPLVYYGVAAMSLFMLVASLLNVVSIVLGVDIPGIPTEN